MARSTRWIAVGAVVVGAAVAIGVVGCVGRDQPELRRSSCRDLIIGTAPRGEAEDVVQVLSTDAAPQEVAPGWSARSPAISPDGRRVAVVRSIGEIPTGGGSPDAEELWVVGLDGSDPVRLSSGGAASTPAWSPDGRDLVFTWQRGEETVIATVPADGSAAPATLVGPPQTWLGNPAWSPDGSHLAFTRGHEVVVGDARGRDRRSLGTFEHEVAGLTWDPGGASMVVGTVGGDPFRVLWRVRLDGGAPEGLGTGWPGRWSRDGERLYLLDPTGDGRLLVSTAEDDAGPATAIPVEPPLRIEDRTPDL